MSDSQLLLAGDHLALVFPYDIVQVREVKQIPGARWDRLSKTWRAPLRSLPEARAFAEKHGFFIEDDLAKLDLPDTPTSGVVKAGKELVITFPYDEVKIAAIRGVTGARWRPDDFAWVAPSTSLLEVFAWAEDFNVDVSQEILDEIGRVEDSKAGLFGLSNRTHLDQPLDTSGLNGELLPFQHVGVAYALQARRTFIADSMGLGKTVQAIAALHLGDALPAVVVCPPTLVLNWVNEIHNWLPDAKIVTLAGMAKKNLTDKVKRRKPASPAAAGLLVRLDTSSDPQDIANHLEDADFVVLGYSVVGAWRPVLSPRSLVCDESQYIKNKKAKRTKATLKLAKELPEDGMTLCLTGTPVLNRPAEFYPQLAALGHISDFGGEWSFYKRYCGMYTDRWGKVDISGATHKEELNERLRSTCYVRRTKEEVLPDLTPIRHQIVPVQGDTERMKEYRKAEDDIARYMAERAAAIALELGLDPRSAAVMAKIKAESAEHIVRLSALRRIAALAKMPTIKELVDSHLEEGSKVVIAGHHRDVVSGLADQYGGLKIQGGMSVDDVEQFKARFQDGADPVMVLSIQAAKAGHTLTAAQDIIMAELPWTPADADQVIARLHRIGQEGSVLATWLLCNDTIDHEIYTLLQEKRAVVDAVTDGGVAADVDDVVGGLLVSLVQRGFDLS